MAKRISFVTNVDWIAVFGRKRGRKYEFDQVQFPVWKIESDKDGDRLIPLVEAEGEWVDGTEMDDFVQVTPAPTDDEDEAEMKKVWIQLLKKEDPKDDDSEDDESDDEDEDEEDEEEDEEEDDDEPKSRAKSRR